MLRLLVLAIVLAALVSACGSSQPEQPAPSATASDFRVGRPLNRPGIGDADRVLARYERSRAEMIALFRAQTWFQDGLTRDESLFVERSLTFVARYSGNRRVYIAPETVEQKLYLYEKVRLRNSELELLLIYEPGQNGAREMAFLAAAVPALEQALALDYPEKVITVINGDFEINDFSDGQFIRLARCCLLSPFIMAHELAHAYWSVGPAWLNEGMADIYAVMAVDRVGRQPPEGWGGISGDLDSYLRGRRAVVQSGRFPDLPLTRRLASDGLYEAADVFLLELRGILGAEAFLAASRAIYEASDFGRNIVREKRIEDIFLDHAPARDHEQVMRLFNQKVWGDNGERYRELQELEAS